MERQVRRRSKSQNVHPRVGFKNLVGNPSLPEGDNETVLFHVLWPSRPPHHLPTNCCTLQDATTCKRRPLARCVMSKTNWVSTSSCLSLKHAHRTACRRVDAHFKPSPLTCSGNLFVCHGPRTVRQHAQRWKIPKSCCAPKGYETSGWTPMTGASRGTPRKTTQRIAQPVLAVM